MVNLGSECINSKPRTDVQGCIYWRFLLKFHQRIKLHKTKSLKLIRNTIRTIKNQGTKVLLCHSTRFADVIVLFSDLNNASTPL